MFDFFKRSNTEAEVLADIAEGYTPSTQEVKTRQDALSIPAVATSIDWIAGTIASLPIRMYKATESGFQEVYDDYRLNLVSYCTFAFAKLILKSSFVENLKL